MAQEREEREKAVQAQLAQSALDLNQDPKQIVNQIISKINTKLPIGQTETSAAASVKLDPNMASNLTSKEIQNAILRQQQQQQNSTTKLQPNKSPSNSQISPAKSNAHAALSSIDGFSLNHDDELNRFLDDPFKAAAAATFATKSPSRDKLSQPEQVQPAALNNVHESDDDDDDDDANGNPIVAAYKETIDSSDEEKIKSQAKLNKQPVTKPIGMSKNSSTNSSSSKVVVKTIKSIEISDDEVEEPKKVDQYEEEDKELDSKIEINPLEEESHRVSSPPQPPQIQLSIDDFDFLEKMTTSKPPPAVEPKKKVKKSTTKSSNKLLVDVTASDNDDSSSMVSSDSKKTKTKKSAVKSSASKNNLISGIDAGQEETTTKKKSTTKKSSKTTSTKKKSVQREADEDDDDGGFVVKKDLDYEDI